MGGPLQSVKEVPRDFFDRLLHFLKHRKKFQKVVFLHTKGNPDGSLSHYPSLRDFRSKGFLTVRRGRPQWTALSSLPEGSIQ